MPPPPEPSGWTALDGIDLVPVLRQRAFLFQSVPRRLQPTFQQALRLALAGITHPSSGPEQCRGWKLFRSSGDPGPAARAARAERLVHQGELSAARTALTAGPLAPPHPRNPGRVAQP